MENWNIRRATINDAPELENCMHLAYSKHLEKLNGDFLPPLHVDYKDEILNYPVWVVIKDNNLIGGIILIFENNYASVANIGINPNLQGLGLGRFLMKFAEDIAIDKGYSEINLATHILLKDNISFYKKLGWIIDSSDSKKVYMKKVLK